MKKVGAKQILELIFLNPAYYTGIESDYLKKLFLFQKNAFQTCNCSVSLNGEIKNIFKSFKENDKNGFRQVMEVSRKLLNVSELELTE